MMIFIAEEIKTITLVFWNYFLHFEVNCEGQLNILLQEKSKNIQRFWKSLIIVINLLNFVPSSIFKNIVEKKVFFHDVFQWSKHFLLKFNHT